MADADEIDGKVLALDWGVSNHAKLTPVIM
jgi:hypothetical protein